MLKPVLDRTIVLVCLADCTADNHARPLAQFLYETLPYIKKRFCKMILENDLSVLRKRISDYRTEFYKNSHPAVKADINSVEIAINLAEIYIHYRDLTADELRWFKGKRFIDETFQNEWKDIAEQYDRISDYVQARTPNRKKIT